MLRLISWNAIGVCLLAGVTGCSGSGAPTVKTAGIVTYNGQPLSNVNVVFTPTDGRPAFGTTDDQGRFTLTTFQPNDGAVPGQHKVTITSAETEPQPGTPEAAAAGPRVAKFPAKYSSLDTSDLTATVDKSSSDLNFDLAD